MPPWPSPARPYTSAFIAFGTDTSDHAGRSSAAGSCRQRAVGGTRRADVVQTLDGVTAAMSPGRIRSPLGTLIFGGATVRQAPLLQCATATRRGCAATGPVTQSPAAALPLAASGITEIGTWDQLFPL